MTPQTVAVLRELLVDPTTPRYGLDLARETGLKTGTLHPLLARLQQVGWIDSFWEAPADHEESGRPRRRYYRFTSDGADLARQAIADITSPSSARRAQLRPRTSH